MPAQFESINSPIAREPVITNGTAHSHDDDVVISGFSGRLPESSNIEEFKKNLFEGIDMVTDDERRWPKGLYGLPARTGKLKDLQSFDATFFGVHAKQANSMDPQLRLLLEITYEAIVDAGYNPMDLRGSKTGVFIGASASESEEFWTNDPEKANGYGLTGCCRAMFSNRISYTFDFNGPSYSVDTACSSSLYALQQALTAIRTGQCDSAIVGGVNVVLKPTSSLQFHKLNMLSADGMCKAFDSDGKGYVRAEAAVVLLLQKAKDARRTYSTIIHAKTNVDGSKVQGITFPNGEMQYKLMQEVYKEANVKPENVVYVEAHGTGTKVGDPQEVNSIAKIFCKGRKSPLLLGSVKSNMGHSEPASGLCSIAKMLIAMEAGIIPANLHFKEPNSEIPSLFDGSIRVVDKPMPWNGGLVAINSFGFGGANAHIILRSNPKPKLFPVSDNQLPKMVGVSGRTEEGVNMLLDKVKEHEKDDELIALVHDIHQRNITGHPYRGYQILGTNHVRKVDQTVNDTRPIWYVFTGMGSQWAGMGQKLFCVEPFLRSIRRSADTLKTVGIDLMDLLQNGTAESYENVTNSFVTIAAIQVALVDVLTLLDIQPDGIVGHSVGEVGCAYADGTFTAEQTVLTAYWRGKSIHDVIVDIGGMAALGVTWEKAKELCPPNIFPACHNSKDSVTVSGPVESIKKFVGELKEQGIFAKVVNSSGQAFHSKYISAAGPQLRAALEKIIPNPKQRSSKWISSSIPEYAWGTPLAQLSSAAYHVNNLLSPVLFHEAISHIPPNAIVVEIAPHCLLRAVLRRSLAPTVSVIGLHNRDHADNLQFLLTSIGDLYVAGGQPNFAKLYPPISYPVGRGTPMLNSLVGWDHSNEWGVADFAKRSEGAGELVVTVDLSKETDAYLAGHTIDGRILFPATGYLTIVWKMLAKLRTTDIERLPVVFEDVHFYRATILPKDGTVKFLISIFTGTGEFEICENGSVVVKGKISVPENIDNQMTNLPVITPKANTEWLDLNTSDIYKELRLRGYDYDGIFQGIKSCNSDITHAKLTWANNWISYMDTMLQISVFTNSTRGLYLPTRLQYLAINPSLHLELTKDLTIADSLPLYNYTNIGIIKSGGIEIRGMKGSLAPRRGLGQPAPKHERYTFVPYENGQALVEDPYKGKLHALTVLLQIVRENIRGIKIKIVEVAGERAPEALLAPMVLDIFHHEPLLSAEIRVVSTTPETYVSVLQPTGIKSVNCDTSTTVVGQDLHLVVAPDVLTKASSNILQNLNNSIRSGGFLILEETDKFDLSIVKDTDLLYVGQQCIHGKTYVLLKKAENKAAPTIIHVTEKNFAWVERIKTALKKIEPETQVLLVCQGEELFGMAGLVNCIRLEDGGEAVRYVFIQDKNAPKFQPNAEFYSKQLNKQLVANVLKGGQWGSFRHLRLDQHQTMSSLQVEHAYINALYRGDLSSLRWIESPLSYYHSDQDPNSEICYVYYAPLNFRDIMLATGKLPPDALPNNMATQDCILGLEFSGRNSKGRRVMAAVAARSLATTVLADPHFMWEVPDKWTLEEAATIPVAYSTAYYALFVRGRLQPGESVLIHAGTGGVGQACISIALHRGCTVFTTVGTPEKRSFLKNLFPQLTDKHIGNSRDTTFEQLILSETNGRGVDVVVNSLAEEKLQASVRCLAIGGRFLEIGKYDLSNNTPLRMSVFLKNTAFHGILLDALFEGDNSAKREVVALVNEGIKNGAVRPLQTTVFSEHQIEQAFRFMATGKHIGKVLLKIREEEKERISQPTLKTVPAIPRTYMNPKKSYILVGGLGGFGLELAAWMVTRGAKFIILTSRSGVRTGYQSMCIRRWRETGVNIGISTADATTMSGAEKLIKEANKLAPVGGIFNLAAVLKDNLLSSLGESHFQAVAAPKVDATKNLDAVSRKHCPILDYFVVFSSISCGRGNVGQSNYGLANSAMERIVEQRQANGLPGLAIQWGAIGDVGLITEMLGNLSNEVGGTLPQRISSCLTTMDAFLQQPHPVLSAHVVPDKSSSEDDASKVKLTHAVANILGITKTDNINPSNSLAELGMDSLMGTEIKQTLERNYDLVLSAQEIRNLTFGRLLELEGNTGETVEQATESSASKEHTKEVLFECDGKEIVPTESLVKLQSKSSNGPPLFLFHAMEGLISSLKSLANELERPVWGFQCTKTVPTDTIPELAGHYVKLMKTVQKEGPYHLVGYSYGACVAFESALQLENAGERTVLTLVDGSPDFVKLHSLEMGKQASQQTEDATSDAHRKIISFFVRELNSSITFLKAYEILKETKSEAESLDKMVELIGTTNFNPEDLKLAAVMFYKKLLAANVYKPSGKFKNNVMLIKAKDSFLSIEKDYGLSQFCEQDVRIEELPGNHRSILKGDSAKKIADLLRV